LIDNDRCNGAARRVTSVTVALSEADVRAAGDIKTVMAAIEAALLDEHDGAVLMPPRTNLMCDGGFLRLMPAYLVRMGVYGFKSFHGSMKRGVRYLVVLCREEDGEILAILDGALLTALRTGATSGIATKYMAPDGPAVVAVLGSGLEAETNLAAVAAVRPVASVRVFSPNPARRAAMAERTASNLGLDARPMPSAKDAVRDATIVLVATNTGHNGPTAYHGAWMETGQHVVSIGATSPFLRELDEQAFHVPDHVVFDAPPTQVFDESGDLMAIEGALRHRLLGAATLPGVVASGGLDRRGSDVSLFKSVGTAAQDVAAAKAVFDGALAAGLGRDLGELARPRVF
jgi:ornithine cyclodeaminase/alanine dehydrogenase